MTNDGYLVKETGRPLKYDSPEALERAVSKYFDDCDSRLKTFVDKDGNETTALVPQPYTMAGLAYSIGVDRNTITNYQKQDYLGPIILDAKRRVEADMERRLYETSNQAGIIFGLKNNYGWRDEQQITSTNKTETTVIYRPEKLPEPIEGEIVDKGLPEPK